MEKIYPDSGVELNPFIAKNYDKIMNIGTFGKYRGFINSAIKDLNVNPDDHVLDLGCGTGRNANLISTYLGENGKVIGLDISIDMKRQFTKNESENSKIEFKEQRIDIPFDLNKQFDKIFISFVIHGFPHEIRDIVIKNAYNHLKPGGTFHILDFAEFDINKMPAHHRFIFKKVECKYAFDFIDRDWKSILETYGFKFESEFFYFKNYLRLLTVKK